MSIHEVNDLEQTDGDAWPAKQSDTWSVISDDRYEYHLRQFQNEYESTRRLREWLIELGILQGAKSRGVVVDIGSGMGANLHYLARQHSDITFQGWEVNEDLVEKGNAALSQLGSTNASLHKVNLFSLPNGAPLMPGEVDGIVSFQLMSWLPAFIPAAEAMLSLRPRWWACSSLFYEGPISADITVKTQSGTFPYNVYSLDEVRKFFLGHGYTTILARPFEIGIDLPRPSTPQMQTYTETTLDGRRLQISGPILMPWYFVVAF